MEYNTYDYILQSDPTEAAARLAAMAFDWSEIGTTKCNIGCGRYIDTLNGVEVYYDYGADYYFFCPVD